MPALDIFSSSAFSMVALTDAINKMPYVPGRIGQLGLFRGQGVSTNSVMIEEREGSLNLVETTARGAPAIQNTTNKRKARSLVVPHIALEDAILADEVQNVRAFGSESMLEGVQAVVNQRMSEMATKMDATLKHLRIGAIKGQILDADGSAVIYDLFTEFGVTAHSETDFDLDNASPAPGVIKKKCHDIRRKIEDELGAQRYEHIHAICGADFFDDLITHSEVGVGDHAQDRARPACELADERGRLLGQRLDAAQKFAEELVLVLGAQHGTELARDRLLGLLGLLGLERVLSEHVLAVVLGRELILALEAVEVILLAEAVPVVVAHVGGTLRLGVGQVLQHLLFCDGHGCALPTQGAPPRCMALRSRPSVSRRVGNVDVGSITGPKTHINRSDEERVRWPNSGTSGPCRNSPPFTPRSTITSTRAVTSAGATSSKRNARSLLLTGVSWRRERSGFGRFGDQFALD
jgi:hypothetical protein